MPSRIWNTKTQPWKYLLGNFCGTGVSADIPDIMKFRGQHAVKTTEHFKARCNNLKKSESAEVGKPFTLLSDFELNN